MKILRTLFRGGLVLLLISQVANAEVTMMDGADDAGIQRFGDWGRQCEKSPGGDEICFIYQNVDKKDTKQRMMSIRVFYPKSQDQPAMVVTVPLGTLLPAGAAMMLDGIEPVKMVYLACANEGCATAPMLLSAEVIGAMKKGETASVRVAALNKQVIGLPVSLKGFTKAIGSITP